MGLYDRDYYRRTPPQGYAHGAGGPGRPPIGLRGLATLSMNTWIIVLCVAVFIIDQLTPVTLWQPMPVTSDAPFAVQISKEQRYQPLQVAENETSRMQFPRALVDVGQQPPEVVGMITYQRTPILSRWLHFSTDRFVRHLEFWRVLGFQFLHGNLTHLVVNMIGLFFFGSLVEQHLGSKRYLAFYLLCGICGALMYLLLNLLGITATFWWQDVSIPGLLFSSPFTPLVGASAGIFGVLMAGAYLAPRETVLLFFFIPMQLRTLAYALVGIALYTIITGGHNAGGEAGHLGGAIAGFYFIRHPHHLHNFFDILGRVDPTSHHYRKGAGDRGGRRSPAGGGGGAGEPRWRSRVANPQEIDRILDKINREGLHSLSDEEKRTLAQASER